MEVNVTVPLKSEKNLMYFFTRVATKLLRLRFKPFWDMYLSPELFLKHNYGDKSIIVFGC